MMIDEAVLAFIEAIEGHAQRMAAEGERLLALSRDLREQAVALRAAGEPVVTEARREPEPVTEPPVQAPPKPPVDAAKGIRTAGKKGIVNERTAEEAARRLGRFSRRALAQELGLTLIGVSKFLSALERRGVIHPEGGEFVAGEAPADRALAPPIEAAKAAGDRNRQVVYDYLRENGPLALRAIYEGVGLSQTVVSRHLLSLITDGLVVKSGVMKSARYDVSDRQREPGLLEATEAEPSDVEATVRDWFRERTKEFSPRECAAALDLPAEQVVEAFNYWVQRGVLIDESPAADMPLFSYARPVEPGKAAQADAQRRKQAAKVTTRAPADPVAGTGKGIKANDREVQALINAAQAAGAVVSHATNGHFEVRLPGGKRVLIAATPRGSRTVLNDRARLRRAGLSV